MLLITMCSLDISVYVYVRDVHLRPLLHGHFKATHIAARGEEGALPRFCVYSKKELVYGVINSLSAIGRQRGMSRIWAVI